MQTQDVKRVTILDGATSLPHGALSCAHGDLDVIHQDMDVKRQIQPLHNQEILHTAPPQPGLATYEPPPPKELLQAACYASWTFYLSLIHI